ncbi:nucleotidyltransferase family protein [Anaerosphaera multitolerans]|uniref:Molybdenum hydroxylase n=1 Tax=Anaerosphaera multitolerans TaxID=2487351 RepID=A0A437S566_9FIRM|nr:NTP transferase domain-containing protein [Anaerosphaera multitolerans]RVU54134.1 molybdenum hydroxylase [Anaerosphaera multitolerans]
MKISAVILASGMSSRMGENKLKLKYKGKSIFEYTIDLVGKLDFNDRLVITNDDEILNYGEKQKLRVIKNENFKEGKSESVKLGVRNSSEDSLGYMFFVCDQPLLSADTVEGLLEVFKENTEKIIYPMYGDRRGAPMIFPKAYRDKLLTLEKDQGGVIFIREDNSLPVNISSEVEHIDIDTVEDYERLLKL